MHFELFPNAFDLTGTQSWREVVVQIFNAGYDLKLKLSGFEIFGSKNLFSLI